MSRYRKVESQMYGDEKFMTLSAPEPNAQSLWFYLLTGPETTGFPGVIHAGPVAIAEALKWIDKPFREPFNELFFKGMLRMDENARLIFLPNGFKHNPPANPNVVKGWGKLFNELPECELKTVIYQTLKDFLVTFDKPFMESFDKSFNKPFSKQYAESVNSNYKNIVQSEPAPCDNVKPESESVVSDSDSTVETVPDKPSKLSPEEIVELYNILKPDEWAACQRITSDRRKKINQTIKEWPNVSDWEKVFANMRASTFLRGLTSKGIPFNQRHRCIDWLFSSGMNRISNFLKIYEGKYADEPSQASTVDIPTMEETIETLYQTTGNPLEQDPF